MPKRKVKSSTNNVQKIVSALFRIRELHSPCINSECPIEFRHCTGCNEPFPCKTIYALEGTSPLKDTITLYGDQNAEQSSEEIVVTKEITPEDNH